LVHGIRSFGKVVATWMLQASRLRNRMQFFVAFCAPVTRVCCMPHQQGQRSHAVGGDGRSHASTRASQSTERGKFARFSQVRSPPGSVNCKTPCHPTHLSCPLLQTRAAMATSAGAGGESKLPSLRHYDYTAQPHDDREKLLREASKGWIAQKGVLPMFVRSRFLTASQTKPLCDDCKTQRVRLRKWSPMRLSYWRVVVGRKPTSQSVQPADRRLLRACFVCTRLLCGNCTPMVRAHRFLACWSCSDTTASGICVSACPLFQRC
jgi:hypothetical protein